MRNTVVLILALIAPGIALAVPTITVQPLIASASEAGPNPGIFEFTRTESTAAELVVNFTFGGTAQRNTDYLAWETVARFAPGNAKAWVTIIPRNDTLQESSETVSLTLAAGSGYALGTTSSATVRIADIFFPQPPVDAWSYFRPSIRGAFDLPSPCYPGEVVGFCTPVLSKDLEYLNAWIAPDGGIQYLWVDVGIKTTAPLVNLAIYLDTDRNPTTGDVRPGFQGGSEYRINASVSPGLPPLAQYELKRLPSSSQIPDIFALIELRDPETLVGKGQALWNSFGSFNDTRGVYRVRIPLSQIGNPTAVDVVATTFSNGGGGVSRVAGDGDRVPDFGAFATDVGQIVVRRPGVSQLATITDPTTDKVAGSTGFGLKDVLYEVVADQFFLDVGFEQSFDPRVLGATGPSVEILFDGDRNIGTGGLTMGTAYPSAKIPSWGGDTRLLFLMEASIPKVLLQFDPHGLNVEFGGDYPNDGRWLSTAFAGIPNHLQFTGSLSLLDSFSYRHTIDASGVERDLVTRNATGGGSVIMQLLTNGSVSTPLGSQPVTADRLPDGAGALDSRSNKRLSPLALHNPPLLMATDPQEGLGGLGGLDFSGVTADVVGNNLVFFGNLYTLSRTEVGLLYSVLLDTDNNAATGTPIKRPGSTTTVIGADFRLEIGNRDTGLGTTHTAKLVRCPQGGSLCQGAYSLHEGIVDIQPNPPANPPYVVATIPLQILRDAGAVLGSQLRFVIASGQDAGADQIDLVPNAAAILPLPVTPRPDLIVTSITASPAVPAVNGTFSATLTLKNQGTASSAASTVAIWANQAAGQACNALSDKTAALASLAPGATATLTVTGLAAGVAGPKTLRAFVDSKCVVTESNDTNNQRTLTYTVAPPAPDLVISALSTTPAAPPANTVFNATLTVKNQGSASSAASTLNVWSNLSTTPACNTVANKTAAIAALAAGASATVTVTGLSAGATGSKILRAFADGKCVVAESLETNNQRTLAYTVP